LQGSFESTTLTYGDITIDAGAGSDIVYSGAGNDTIYGGAGDDYLDAGDGNNMIYGGAGVDEMHGGVGNDQFFLVSDGNWTGTVMTGDIEQVNIGGKIISQDIYNGGFGDDTLNGTSGSDVFIYDVSAVSAAAANQLDASLRNTLLINDIEHINMGDGDDVVNLLSANIGYGDVTIDGGNGNDWIWSSSGNDTLTGGAGNDYLSGGLGDDIINGGAGTDTMRGGDGNDTFVFGTFAEGSNGGNLDTIMDFTSGQDKIDLQNILFGAGSNLTSFVHFMDDGAGNTMVQVDVDGAANGQNFVDMIKLQGVTANQVTLNDIVHN
jgi:Ca2+-binding RTX toxin-like protein